MRLPDRTYQIPDSSPPDHHPNNGVRYKTNQTDQPVRLPTSISIIPTILHCYKSTQSDSQSPQRIRGLTSTEVRAIVDHPCPQPTTNPTLTIVDDEPLIKPHKQIPHDSTEDKQANQTNKTGLKSARQQAPDETTNRGKPTSTLGHRKPV